MKGKVCMLKRVFVVVFCLALVAGNALQSFGPRVFAQSQTREREAGRAAAPPAAEVTVTLNEQFFNSLLDVIFSKLNAPTFPLSVTRIAPGQASPEAASSEATTASLSHSGLKPGYCESMVRLEREMGGVKTAVRFEQGRVIAPLAFTGSYSVALIGCINFQGWADTVINLNFDRERQVLSARVTVADIHLSNIPSLASGVIVGLVQNSIDRRINPVEILQAGQISTRLSITGSGGALRMRATEIRPVVVPGALSLHIFYEFTPAG
jgi:hypothetical protein